MIRKFSWIILFCTALLIIAACNISFDKRKWTEMNDPSLPLPSREKMLKELITNHKLVGLKYDQLIGILSTPDYSDSISSGYNIIIHWDGIDPDHVKTINFTLSKDSIITGFKVEEWTK